MKVMRWSRQLAWAAAYAALALGTAVPALAIPVPAQARVTATVSPPHVVASWGLNNTSQLGDGTLTDRWRYGDIGAGQDVVQVAAGYGNPAGHGLALRSDGTVWSWGVNDFGQLGDDTRTDWSVPGPVPGLTGVTQVAAACDHSLALRSDGTVSAWGGNAFGELGNGSTANSAVPVKVAGLTHVTSISAGWDSSVATATNGISAVTSVWTWGNNDDGQLGDGTLTSHTTPGRVTGLPVYIASVAVGDKFTAVLGTDGSVWGWGVDNSGQLGNAPASAPVTRPVNTIGIGSGISQISAGLFHMLALKSDGTVLAWGDNGHGALGTGTTTSVTGPVRVAGLTGATQVAAGARFSFAVHAAALVTVPVLTGDSTTQAAQVLQATRLVLGAVTKVTDKYCDHLGTVMNQSPAVGTVLSPGSAVSVTIGQPPPGGCP